MRSGSGRGIVAVKPGALGGQDAGDEQRPARDAAARPGTNGAFAGLSGDERRAITRGFACGVALISAVTVVNILTILHDSPNEGVLPPVIWETSSALGTFLVFALPALVSLWTHRTAPSWRRAAPVHLVAALIYSGLHVAGFLALRHLAYALWVHEPYAYGPLRTEFPYELRKDLLSYGLAFTVFWLLGRDRSPVPVATTRAPAVFDIRDGARLVRAPIETILAVRSAGNYAEFLLADGRRPLMRSSLGALEARLGDDGFVRTHRSWLVNVARVTGLRPEGSGDHTVELGAVEAPVSRRYPEALERLRA